MKMKSSAALATLLALVVRPDAEAAQFKISTHNFTVPDGFQVELVAGPPLVERPIVADFDEQGRLYVADSSGSNDKVDKQLAEKPHRIVRLEDTDGDGRFDKSIVFADKMMFPEGAMWFNGSLFVSAPPSIWRLTDTTGDGIADQREEWFKGKTLTGCANDLHGPYAGPDGWIYWCKGAFAKQIHERPGKTPFETRAAHIFRCRPDGSGLEPVMTGGMDNPVDVIFTPGGERIFTTTFFQHPGGGKRDGLVHAIYGGVYGKPHDVVEGHKRTGDLMPVLTHLGPAAPAGLTRYQGRAMGEDYQDNLFACLFNLHKITRHALIPEGATFRTADSDFLVSDNVDFHPTDVVEDADGSLLVLDTGGWYKLCCPTSQLWKPDVLGAIYRVRRVNSPALKDPRGLQVAWARLRAPEMARLLGDERPAVRQRAVNELPRFRSAAVPAIYPILQPGGRSSRDARLAAIWALTRIDGSAARQAVRGALSDANPVVCQAAVHSVSIWRDAEALDKLTQLLAQAPPPVRRAAAEAIGRIGQPTVIPQLLAAAAAGGDRVLEHSLTYALIEIDAPAQTAIGLRAANPQTQGAALIALDQMSGENLQPEQVILFLAHSEPLLRERALWILGRHPQWGEALAGYFKHRFDVPWTEGDQAQMQELLARFARTDSIQTLLAGKVAEAQLDPMKRLTALRSMARSGLKELPAEWVNVFADMLSTGAPELQYSAVAVMRAVPLSKEGARQITPILVRWAQNESLAPERRLEALASVPGGLETVGEGLFSFLVARVSADNAVNIRSLAAGVLSRARVSDEQLNALSESLRKVGPMELPRLLTAYERSGDEALGMRLVASLKESAGVAALRPETLKPRLTNFPEVVRQQAEHLLATLNTDAPKQKAHLDELAAQMAHGDIRRGQAIFNSSKAACSSCHAIGYLGGNIGPDLTRIGQIRTERDLLEAIVYPSASFVRSFEPVVVAVNSGEEHNGVLRNETPEEVIVATGPTSEIRVSRSEIREMRPGAVSVMPAGLDEQITRQELADLVAFLKSTRW